jgi:hypothetical protein
MFTFRNKFLKNPIYYNDLNDEFHESYYGGRTEAFKIGKVNAKVYDVNSMYPYAMTKVFFPDTKLLKKEINVDVKYLLFLLGRYEGLAKIKVFHKDSFFGFLPCRMKVDKSVKLLFPVGTFETTVNFNELRFAIEKNIVEIISCEFVIYANAIESPFIEFINFHYEHKISTNNELEKMIDKLKSNSLYGKFGQKIKYNTEYFDLLPFEIIEELKINEKFYELKMFSQLRNDCFLTTERKEYKNSFFAIPSFSSYITSYCRVLLLKSLLENEKNGVVYCDTDSVFLEGEFLGKVNNELGSFKLENKTVTEIRGLKNYSAIENGIPKDIIKGVSKNSVKITEGKYEVMKYYKTLESLRRNIEAGLQYKMIKELKHKYDKRTVLKNGMTLPIELPMAKIDYVLQEKINRTLGAINKRESTRILNVLKNEPQTLHEAILMYFISGGKIKTGQLNNKLDKNTLKYKRLIFTSKNGSNIDNIQDDISESFTQNIQSNDFENEVMSIVQDYKNKYNMCEYFENQVKETTKQFLIPEF